MPVFAAVLSKVLGDARELEAFELERDTNPECSRASEECVQAEHIYPANAKIVHQFIVKLVFLATRNTV